MNPQARLEEWSAVRNALASGTLTTTSVLPLPVLRVRVQLIAETAVKRNHQRA
jgi:hypothetical protein